MRLRAVGPGDVDDDDPEEDDEAAAAAAPAAEALATADDSDEDAAATEDAAIEVPIWSEMSLAEGKSTDPMWSLGSAVRPAELALRDEYDSNCSSE